MGEAGAQAPVQEQLPNVGAAYTRAWQGPRKKFRTAVYRSSRPSPAALEAIRQERRERESCWAVHGSLHQDRAETVIQPCKRNRVETTQIAVTLQPWTGARVVEGSH